MSLSVKGLFAVLIVQHGMLAMAGDASVATGIANTGSMTIEGDVAIEVNITPTTNDLISVLNLRAERIIEKINRGQYKGKDEFITMFVTLHEKHIQLLKEGNLMAAHEVLSEIHRLSYEYELAGGLRFSYFCSRIKYIRGSIVNAYIVDQFEKSSKKYELNKSEIEANKRQSGSGCGPLFQMAAIPSIENIYNLIDKSK